MDSQTATLRFPTFGRLIDELDGAYQGLSLYDYVANSLTWEPRGKQWSDPSLLYAQFKGIGTNVSATYHAARWRPGLAGALGFPYDVCRNSEVKIRFKELDMPDTVVRAETYIKGSPGSAKIRISRANAEDDIVPVGGAVIGSSVEFLAQRIEEARAAQRAVEGSLLLGTACGQIFVACMALELSIRWDDASLDVSVLKDKTMVAQRFADVINNPLET